MGAEARCNARYGEATSEGRAMLETAEVIFRGAFTLKIPFSAIESVVVEGGWLRLGYQGSTAALELGRDAEKWAEKIRNPRGRLQKLGVEPGMRVVAIGVEDEAFLAELDEAVGDLADEASGELDIIFYAADSLDELLRLPLLRGQLKPAGAIWVVSRKGKAATLKDVQVMAAARESGLVDNKVVAFSQTHTALRLVIPRDRR